jgi:dTDP-4-dehydrorhamnose 3,5-epimerase
LKIFTIELSEENQKMIYIPKGFAHGFQTLEDETQLLYFHSSIYAPLNEDALNIKDPLLDIKWPLNIINLSKRDESHPFLTKDFKGININAM